MEDVYQECLEIELELRGIPFEAQYQVPLTYKGRKLKSVYKPDFNCFGKIILEIKAVAELADIHRAQVQNYLKGTGYRLGLLVNFNHYPKVEYKRIAL